MQQTEVQYASFNRRIFAAFLDLFMATLIFFPLMHPINAMIFGDRTIEVIMSELTAQTNDNISGDLIITQLFADNYFPKYLFSQFVLLVMIGIYTVAFWHKMGATPGKYLFGCKVVDAKTKKLLSLPKCIARFCYYVFSALPLFIGFFMIDFNKNKVGIHDYLCGSNVIREKLNWNISKYFQFLSFSKQK